ncbi:hypothetical protein VP01_1890g2, partial [Puccinia sorghi]
PGGPEEQGKRRGSQMGVVLWGVEISRDLGVRELDGSGSRGELLKLPRIPEINYELPQLIQPFVEIIYDVRRDEHCRYRAISACLSRGPDCFIQIHQNILQEIQNRRQWYQRDPTITDVQECEISLLVPHSGP